jgi:hypothetical protein
VKAKVCNLSKMAGGVPVRMTSRGYRERFRRRDREIIIVMPIIRRSTSG